MGYFVRSIHLCRFTCLVRTVKEKCYFILPYIYLSSPNPGHTNKKLSFHLCLHWVLPHHLMVFPSRVSGRGYKIGPVCVCVSVSVCLLVSALTAEPFDIQTRNLLEALTLIISQMSSKVKVIGQRSRSPG